MLQVGFIQDHVYPILERLLPYRADDPPAQPNDPADPAVPGMCMDVGVMVFGHKWVPILVLI